MAFNTSIGLNQVLDSPIPSPPSDTIYSLSLNGTIQSFSTMLIAGSWDTTVSYSSSPPYFFFFFFILIYIGYLL